jgi:dihydroneopterin triphosphate diphosphatase
LLWRTASLGETVPQVASDIVDAYIFRRTNGRVQFLLLQRHNDLPLGGTWQSIHAKIEPNESALEAAERAVRVSTGLEIVDAFSADYINQFYDHETDTIILAPVFAFTVVPKARVALGPEYVDSFWCEREEATARLLWTGQRWAVRHIDEVIAMGGEESEYYRVR